jgi:hypothetical protein
MINRLIHLNDPRPALYLSIKPMLNNVKMVTKEEYEELRG